jgi:hypothetical protein
MFRIESPFSDTSLLLTPTLGSYSRVLQSALLMGMLALILFFIFRLYLYEARLIARRFSLTLLGLRLFTIALVFFVIGFKPKLVTSTQETLPSRVLIALDLSDSMNISDPQRGGLEKIQLARGLHLAADIAMDRELDDWINTLNSGGTLSNSNRRAYQQLVARIDPYTRRDIADRVLSADGIDILGGLKKKHNLDIIGFDQRVLELPKDMEAIREILAGNTKTPGNAFTDLKVPLKRGMDRTGDEGKLLGIVILTDGRHNWGESPLNWIMKANETTSADDVDELPKQPVYAIVCGPRIPPSDVAVTSLKAMPPTVFKHADATIEARILINNMPKGRIKVTLTYPESPDLPNRKPVVEYIDHDGSLSTVRRITLKARMDRAASETLTVTAEPEEVNGKKPEDRFPENNKKTVIVNVSPDKAKVLVVDGEARWELHYLHTALVRDETMETKSVVFDQPRLNLVKEDEVKLMHLPDLRLPEGEDALMAYDCIIVGDVSNDQLPLVDRERIERYVSERGGTLVMLAGKRSMPMEFLKNDDPFLRLLPIQNSRIVDVKRGFQVALTAEGKDTSFLRLENESGLSQEIWAGFPPHYWAIVGKAKEGAVSLAYCPIDGGLFNVEAKGAETERNNAMIVRQNYGFGRSVFVGLDSTWRWRYRKGDVYHHRFWSQIIRWAASDRALVTGNDFVRFGVRQPAYRADEEVEILVRLSDKLKKLPANALAGARFYRKKPNNEGEESTALASLKPHPVVPRELDGKQAGLPPGDYSMELAIPDIEDKLNGPDGKKLRASFKVLPPDAGELLDLSTNWELMEDMAKKTGGEVFAAHEAHKLLEKLQSKTDTRERRHESLLWRSWWLLVPLLMLLAVEWGIRKWAGLP